MLKQLSNFSLVKLSFFVVVLMIICSGCDKELSEIDDNQVLRKLSPQEIELINSTNSLSVCVLKTEYNSNREQNFMFSPLSVGMALGMIYNSVGENEKLQIQQVLGLESLEEKEINKSYNELLNFIQVSNDQFQISYANSLWFSHDIDVNEVFRTKVMAYYDAEISEINLNKPHFYDFINDWGSMKTNGSFDFLINKAPEKSSEIFFINALSLNTGWTKGETFFRVQRDFTGINNKSLKVNTLNWEGLDVKLNSSDAYSFIELPFENDQFKLLIIQPEIPESMSDLLEHISSNELAQIADNALEFKANVSIPDIDFFGQRQMKSTLSELGLNNIFLSSADLSPSFVSKGKNIAGIRHLAKIDLNTDNIDNFSEAADFTSAFESTYVNKPFLYFVKDRHTNSILFAGFYTNSE